VTSYWLAFCRCWRSRRWLPRRAPPGHEGRPVAALRPPRAPRSSEEGCRPRPPTKTPPTIAGTPKLGGRLTASPGSWSGTAPITFTYQWLRCQPDCTQIPGATGQSYTLTKADAVTNADGAETYIGVFVEASNIYGSVLASLSQSPVVSIEASLPRPRNLETALEETTAMVGSVGELPQLLRVQRLLGILLRAAHRARRRHVDAHRRAGRSRAPCWAGSLPPHRAAHQLQGAAHKARSSDARAPGPAGHLHERRIHPAGPRRGQGLRYEIELTVNAPAMQL
jgi:hypothetical protein